MKKTSVEWKIYRTRFLVKAKKLSEPLAFVDALGHEHCGRAGDYLVESSDGGRRIAPREIFEDVYVPMGRSRRHDRTLSGRTSSSRSLNQDDSGDVASA